MQTGPLILGEHGNVIAAPFQGGIAAREKRVCVPKESIRNEAEGAEAFPGRAGPLPNGMARARIEFPGMITQSLELATVARYYGHGLPCSAVPRAQAGM